MADEYVIKEPDASAEPLIYSSYLHSLWDSRGTNLRHGQTVKVSRDIAGLTKTEFFPVYHKRLESLLSAADRILLCVGSATPGEEEWVGAWLLGDAHGGKLRIHWVFVKTVYRRRGFATALLDAALRRAGDPTEIVATHEHPRWARKMAEMGIVREPLGRVGT